MNPEYPNGSIIFIKRINEIRKGEMENGIACYSTNPDPKYQPFNVDFNDLYGMFRVVMCMTMK